MTHFNELGVLLHQLGLEESVAKSCPPSPEKTCLGVELSSLDFTLSVDSARLVKIESLLCAWLHKWTTMKSSLQSLVGKLVFVSKCVRQSWVFIAQIFRLLQSVKFNHHHINLNSEFCKDIQWRHSFLRVYNGVSMISINDWSSPGFGGLCEYGYFHEEFPEFISVQQLDINCLELLTIVVVLKMWGHLWQGLRLTVWCDNAVAATALNSGRCQDDFLNSYLREIGFLAATQKFEFRVVHLPGVLNSEADLLLH